MNSDIAPEYIELKKSHKALEVAKKMAQDKFTSAVSRKEYDAIMQAKLEIVKINKKDSTNRQTAKTLIKKADDDAETNDKDYVFIHFILNNLPKGLIGLLLAVILSAAMSSTASELNALGTITALDLYKRNNKETLSDTHYVNVSKGFTLLWGVIAISIACVANLFDNLIQLVNIIGSIFYGNVLGIFLLAFFIKFVKGNAVFFAAILTQIIIILLYYNLIYIYPSGQEKLGYLWLNFIGAALVILLAIIFEFFDRFLRTAKSKN